MSQLTNKAKALLHFPDWVIDWFFSYDFFISYAHADGNTYPRKLVEQLNRDGFRAFLDEHEYKAGDDLRIMTRRRVRHSTHLVIIGRLAALTESEWVPLEVNIYREARGLRDISRAPIVINVNDALEEALKKPRQVAPLAHLIEDSKWIWIPEQIPDADASPSEQTVVRLRGAFEGIRQDTKRMRIFGGLTLIFALITAWALVQWDLAEQQAAIATSRRLVVEANTTPQDSPQKRILLATEAVAVAAKTPIQRAYTEQALRDQLSTVSGKALITNRDAVLAANVSPDNHWLVTIHEEGSIEFRDMSNPMAIRKGISEDTGRITAWSFSPDSRWLLTGNHRGQLRLWNLTGSQPWEDTISLDSHADMITLIVFDVQSKRVFTSDRSGKMVYMALSDHKPKILQEHGKPTSMAAFYQSGKALATTAMLAEKVRLWNLNTLKELPSAIGLETNNEGITHMAVSANDRWVFTLESSFEDDVVSIWDLSQPEQRQPHRQLEGHPDQPGGFSLSPDGRWLIMASLTHTLALHDLEAVHPFDAELLLQGDNEWAPFYWVSADGNQLLTVGGYTDQIESWDLSSENPSNSLKKFGRAQKVQSVKGSPKGRWLAAGSESGQVFLVDISADKPKSTILNLNGHESPSEILSISEEFDWILSTSSKPARANDNQDKASHKEIRLWRLSKEHPRLSADMLNIEKPVQSLTACPRDSCILVQSDYRDLHIFNSPSQPENRAHVILRDQSIAARGQFKQGAYGIRVNALSNNGTWLATAGHGENSLLWHMPSTAKESTPQKLLDKDTGYYGVTALAFTPSNDVIIAGFHTGNVSLWKIQISKDISPYASLEADFYVRQLAVSSNSRFLAVRYDGGKAGIWNLEGLSGKEQKPFFVFPEDQGGVKQLLFTAKADEIILLKSETLEIWDIGEQASNFQLIRKIKIPSNDTHFYKKSIAQMSNDGELVAVAANKELYLWNYNTWQKDLTNFQILLNKLENDVITHLAFNGNEQLAAGTSNGDILIWNLMSKPATTDFVRLRGHKEEVTALSFSTDGTHIYSGSADGTVRVWHLPLTKLIARARSVVNRNFTEEEWSFHFGQQKYHQTFPGLQPDDSRIDDE